MTVAEALTRVKVLRGDRGSTTIRYPGAIGRFKVVAGTAGVEVFDERGEGKRPATQVPGAANKYVFISSTVTFDAAYPSS